MNEALAKGRRVSAAGIAVNGVLAVVKLTAGIAGHSYALVAGFSAKKTTFLLAHGGP